MSQTQSNHVHLRRQEAWRLRRLSDSEVGQNDVPSRHCPVASNPREWSREIGRSSGEVQVIMRQSTPVLDVSGQVIDEAAILERLEGDIELLHEVIDLFLAECPQRLANMRNALAQADGPALARAAHSLLGSLGMFAAANAAKVATELETLARSGNVAGAADLCAALEQEVVKVRRSLAALK